MFVCWFCFGIQICKTKLEFFFSQVKQIILGFFQLLKPPSSKHFYALHHIASFVLLIALLIACPRVLSGKISNTGECAEPGRSVSDSLLIARNRSSCNLLSSLVTPVRVILAAITGNSSNLGSRVLTGDNRGQTRSEDFFWIFKFCIFSSFNFQNRILLSRN